MMKKGIICVLICMLMVLTSVVPISATTSWKTTSQPLNMGNILYVGGSGPNNYTKIQDAIDNASDGDTVFVYDDSSPYYENIVIEKSIILLGEDRETTVILGDESWDDVIVNISADEVSISGFTIQPNNGNPTGILIGKKYVYPDYWNIEIIGKVTISNNIIKKTGWAAIFGIRLHQGNISENIIEDCSCGILLFISSDTTVTKNLIAHCLGFGIEIEGTLSPYRILNLLNPHPKNNIISQNTIKENRWGIELGDAINTKITDNNILDNSEIGIRIGASNTEITRNNFIGNTLNAYFMSVCVVRYPRYLFNSWDGNYWGEPKKLPVSIPGELWFMPFPRLPISISFPNFSLTQWELKWMVFDKHPAQEPYDIPGMR